MRSIAPIVVILSSVQALFTLVLWLCMINVNFCPVFASLLCIWLLIFAGQVYFEPVATKRRLFFIGGGDESRDTIENTVLRRKKGEPRGTAKTTVLAPQRPWYWGREKGETRGTAKTAVLTCREGGRANWHSKDHGIEGGRRVKHVTQQIQLCLMGGKGVEPIGIAKIMVLRR